MAGFPIALSTSLYARRKPEQQKSSSAALWILGIQLLAMLLLASRLI